MLCGLVGRNEEINHHIGEDNDGFSPVGRSTLRRGSMRYSEPPHLEKAFVLLEPCSVLNTDAMVVFDNPSERITNDDSEWY